MRSILLVFVFVSCLFSMQAQIIYVSPMSGNQGGATSLFNQHVPIGGDMFVDWECFGSGTSGAGMGSSCRIIVRGMTPNADSESVIASDVVCTIIGIYNGENGNNDVFSANMNVCNLPAGRYSLEVQCDDLGGDYDNSTGGSTAATSWNYWTPESPAAYYLGTAGACGEGDGLEDINELGEPGAAGTPQLEYFTVGDADLFRSMVVLNGLFLDLGKFQPGNPTLPANLNDLQSLYSPSCVGVGSFPTSGFCGSDALVLSGAEVNTTKYSTNGSDVTGNRMYYRMYLSTATPPAFRSFNISFNDDCPLGVITTFPVGGSCQNANGIVDQRWQSTSANVNLLAQASAPGLYLLEFYTETDIVDGASAASTIREPSTGSYNTQFTRLDHIDDCGASSSCITSNDRYDFSDIVAIFSSNNCTTCHGTSGGLNLSDYNNVVNGGTNGVGGCSSYSTAIEYLIGKVDGSLQTSQGCGSAMPNGTSYGVAGMSNSDIAAIRSWFDDGLANGCTGLPVELVNFNAKKTGKQSLVYWETASEEGSSHFIVERSTDGSTFEEIGIVDASGFSAERILYEFVDEFPKGGTNYYRLRTVDLDGTESYSGIINILFEGEQRLMVFPTATNSLVTLELSEELRETAMVVLYDYLGKQVLTTRIPVGQKSINIDLSNLQNGIYVVSLSSTNLKRNNKIIKTN